VTDSGSLLTYPVILVGLLIRCVSTSPLRPFCPILRLVQTPHPELRLSSQVLPAPSICQQQGTDQVRYCAGNMKLLAARSQIFVENIPTFGGHNGCVTYSLQSIKQTEFVKYW
jgi:hypothetical protein